jgi:hypothetical protein
MFDTIFSLPVHALIVHATVVIVPTAAVSVILAAVLPQFRRWAGVLPLLLSIAAAVLVPISTSSGEELKKHLPENPLIEKHEHLADGLLLPVLIMLVAATALCWVYLREQAVTTPDGYAATVAGRIGGAGKTVTPVFAVIALVAVIGSGYTAVQVARIGHSGAKAAWSGVAQNNP